MVVEDTKRKSPSTLKRDKERLDNYIKKKTPQETWRLRASSTPSIKTAESKKQDLVTQAFDNVVSETVIDNDLDEPDVDKTNSTETGWNDEDFKRFEMLLEENFSKLQNPKRNK